MAFPRTHLPHIALRVVPLRPLLQLIVVALVATMPHCHSLNPDSSQCRQARMKRAIEKGFLCPRPVGFRHVLTLAPIVHRTRIINRALVATRDAELRSGQHRRSATQLAEAIRPTLGDSTADRLREASLDANAAKHRSFLKDRRRTAWVDFDPKEDVAFAPLPQSSDGCDADDLQNQPDSYVTVLPGSSEVLCLDPELLGSSVLDVDLSHKLPASSDPENLTLPCSASTQTTTNQSLSASTQTPVIDHSPPDVPPQTWLADPTAAWENIAAAVDTTVYNYLMPLAWNLNVLTDEFFQLTSESALDRIALEQVVSTLFSGPPLRLAPYIPSTAPAPVLPEPAPPCCAPLVTKADDTLRAAALYPSYAPNGPPQAYSLSALPICVPSVFEVAGTGGDAIRQKEDLVLIHAPLVCSELSTPAVQESNSSADVVYETNCSIDKVIEPSPQAEAAYPKGFDDAEKLLTTSAVQAAPVTTPWRPNLWLPRRFEESQDTTDSVTVLASDDSAPAFKEAEAAHLKGFDDDITTFPAQTAHRAPRRVFWKPKLVHSAHTDHLTNKHAMDNLCASVKLLGCWNRPAPTAVVHAVWPREHTAGARPYISNREHAAGAHPRSSPTDIDYDLSHYVQVAADDFSWFADCTTAAVDGSLGAAAAHSPPGIFGSSPSAVAEHNAVRVDPSTSTFTDQADTDIATAAALSPATPQVLAGARGTSSPPVVASPDAELDLLWTTAMEDKPNKTENLKLPDIPTFPIDKLTSPSSLPAAVQKDLQESIRLDLTAEISAAVTSSVALVMDQQLAFNSTLLREKLEALIDATAATGSSSEPSVCPTSLLARSCRLAGCIRTKSSPAASCSSSAPTCSTEQPAAAAAAAL